MAQYEEKFIVINKKDLEYLNEDEYYRLISLIGKISKHRKEEGKKLNDYYVCNQDEPYAPKVIETILKGEDEKRSPNVSKGDSQPVFACGNCKYYKKDFEYDGLGNCTNPEVMGSRLILKHCDEQYLTEDFGCRFYKES